MYKKLLLTVRVEMIGREGFPSIAKVKIKEMCKFVKYVCYHQVHNHIKDSAISFF